PAAMAKTLNALLHMPAQMELSQIELIYRAEGNANLVLALPQFKKVLRLPKMISSRQAQQRQCPQTQPILWPEAQPSVSDPTKTKGAAAASAKAGDLTMPDFMAYIEIMRRLLGNEFVCTADIVAIPKESDRFWINEHIRAHRPIERLDKEFVEPFGLLLPDVTQLPATLDALLANLQAKDMHTLEDGISRLGDTYAIEIKPKQGWLQLPSDVSDLFDLMPSVGAATMELPKVQAKCSSCRCRYCSMQLLKLQSGKIKRLGDYCPLALFSGTPSRMLDALHALFACPQNNLRVFQCGNLIYGDHANSISYEELQSRIFPGEIMALIKHLLVACLLREYNSSEQTKAAADTANVDAAAAAGAGAGIVEFVKAVAGQPQQQQQQHTEQATQRYTKRSRIEKKATTETETGEAATATATCWESTITIAPSCLSTTATTTTVTATVTQTETLLATTSACTLTAFSQAYSKAAEAQINKAEIFHLPKNCVLQKILHLQLLVKRHFHYMWQSGYAEHATPSYQALHKLLSQTPPPPAATSTMLTPEQAYMLGATALDCSIMLTFQEIRCATKYNSALQPWLVSLQGRQFLTNVCVLDLDPKPDSHFYKFIKQTRDIENCCRALN
ncbi:Ipk1, partial [Drosophila busckii]